MCGSPQQVRLWAAVVLEFVRFRDRYAPARTKVPQKTFSDNMSRCLAVPIVPHSLQTRRRATLRWIAICCVAGTGPGRGRSLHFVAQTTGAEVVSIMGGRPISSRKIRSTGNHMLLCAYMDRRTMGAFLTPECPTFDAWARCGELSANVAFPLHDVTSASAPTSLRRGTVPACIAAGEAVLSAPARTPRRRLQLPLLLVHGSLLLVHG